MATYVLDASAPTGSTAADVTSRDPVYATAAAGSNLALNTIDVTQPGQYIDNLGSNDYFIIQFIVNFDLSAIPAPTSAYVSAELSFNVVTGGASGVVTEARFYDWGTLSTASYRTASQFAALPLSASRSLNGLTGRQAFTSGTLLADIVAAGKAMFFVCTDAFRIGTTPTGNNNAVAFVSTYTAASSANRPRLTIVTVDTSADRFLNPNVDVAANSWTTQAGGTTDLHLTIDESSADDADYVQSPVAPTSGGYYETRLETYTDPALSTGHVAHYRYKRDAALGSAVNLTVRLMQGTTEIASWAHTGISTSFVTQSQTLTGTQADSITDYANLRLRFVASHTTASTALPSTVPTGDAQSGSWTTDSGGTTGLAAKIDETIAGATDTSDFIQGPAGSAGTSYKADITDMPASFVAMSTLSVNVRYRQSGRTDDTLGLQVLVESAAGVAYTDTITISNITTTTFTNSGATAFTVNATGLAASRTDWNGARVVLAQTYSASMGNDSARVQVSTVELTGTYTAADRCVVSWAQFELPAPGGGTFAPPPRRRRFRHMLVR